jgi:hypothetical protein
MNLFAEVKYWLLFAFTLCAIAAFSATPDSTGLPGDNLDLRATLELFKKSSSPQDFEKKLNSKDQHVNNLDLNADGKVDYLRVYDIMEGNVHAIVIQAPINASESQDVAVIEIEKKGDESAAIQIRGDEEIYGEEAIVQPKPENPKDCDDRDKNKDKQFRKFNEVQTVMFVNVWHWPCVQYMYYPSYVVWVSPWYWSYYPMWWDPWYPYPFYTYYGWNYMYYDYYYCCQPVYVMNDAYYVYQPRRTVSSSVQTRYADAKTAYREAQKRDAVKDQRKPGEGPPPVDENRRAEPAPVPQERQNTDAPQPTEKPAPKPEVKPQPAPAPRPQPAPAPRPRVEPRPTPTPAPVPRPAPSPRPVPRPR